MKAFDPSAIESMSVKELEAQIRHHNHLYFEQHKPEISDYDFDRLVEQLKKLKPDSQVLFEVGSDLRKGVNVPKILHTSPMLSLDKCYDLESLMNWAKKFEGELVASPKIDGCAIEMRYDETGVLTLASTRGDGVKGEDISANVRYVEDIPKKIKASSVEVRGEVYMPLSVFKKFKSEFANPRNLAAGAIKQKLPSKTGDYQLSFFAYDLKGIDFKLESEKIAYLQKLGFKTVECRVLPQEEKKLQAEWDRYLALRSEVDYELDGVVYKANEIREQERLGASAHHPRFSIAYKFQGDSGITTLRQVEWSVARTGVITPIGIVDPVDLSGAKVSRVSLHNYGMVKKLEVTIPSKVLMIRSGGVIPYLEKVLEKEGGVVEIPSQCPSCGLPTEIRDDFLYCTNRNSCKQSKVGELAHFVKVMEIDGFGEVLIEKLYDNGYVEDVADFFTLTKEDLLTLERMGEILATKLIKNIHEKENVPLEIFLQSLGIRELAKHTSKILVKEFGSLEKIMEVDESTLSVIHTIGPVIAREVVAGLQAKRALIQKLLKYVTPAETPVISKGPLQGKTFLFTGTMASLDRKEAEKKVEALAGTIASGVTKELSYLVIGSEGYKNREKGNKWIKAEQLIAKGSKIEIISEEEFLNILK